MILYSVFCWYIFLGTFLKYPASKVCNIWC